MKRPIKKAVFPVGGLGTRFLPATKAMPKEMLPILDKPLIQYAVEEAFSAGIQELIFVTGRGKTAIEDHFDRTIELENLLEKRHNAEALETLNSLSFPPGTISYVRQQEPLGLGHAVWCARFLIGSEPFAVLLADDLIVGQPSCLEQMVAAYQEINGHLVAVQQVLPSETSKYGIFDLFAPQGHEDEHMIRAKGLIEKPHPSVAPSQLAVMGRYILDPKIFEFLERHVQGTGGEIQLTDALAAAISNGQSLYGLPFKGRRFDCGSKEGFLDATLSLAFEDDALHQQMHTFFEKKFLKKKSINK